MDFNNYIKLQERINMVSNFVITFFKFLPQIMVFIFCFVQ